MQPINPGAEHLFTFASPITGLRMYVENFDSFSAAIFSAVGASGISLLTASPDISFTPSSPTTAQLSTSYGGFDGRSDFALDFASAVTSVRITYSNGIQNNSITYTFTQIPSPSAAALLGLGGLMAARRRR